MQSFAAGSKRYREAAESWLSGQDVYYGFCDRCQAVKPMTVNVGVLFGDQPNLREGLRCECGLSGRQRLLYSFLEKQAQFRNAGTACILEKQSKLFRYLSELQPDLCGSEFLGSEFSSGSFHRIRGDMIQHEDFCDLSFPSDSVDLLVHTEVLEHLADYKTALREAYRVLRAPGHMVFTCPFFAMPQTIERARKAPDGSVAHLLEPEYHGDSFKGRGMRRSDLWSRIRRFVGGSGGDRSRATLTFHNFGWSLIEDLGEAGFQEARVCVDYDVFRGLTSCNFPEREGSDELTRCGNMLPLVIEVHKSG